MWWYMPTKMDFCMLKSWEQCMGSKNQGNCKWRSNWIPQRIWILPIHKNTRAVVTQNKKDQLHLGCGWFRSQVHWKSGRRSCIQFNWSKAPIENWLWSQHIPRNQLWIALWWRICHPFNEMIYWKGIEGIPLEKTSKTSAFTIQIHQTYLWTKSTVFKCGSFHRIEW